MEENKDGRHAEPQGSAEHSSTATEAVKPAVQPSASPVGLPPASHKKSGSKLVIVAIVGVVLLGALIVGGCFYRASLAKSYDENKNIATSQYQALFLTNGQVYFGHINDLNNKYVTISDIYYLQVQQNLQQGSGGNTSSQVSLAKLGSELHGPEDKMHVASDQVLFWENLKNDSKVVQAITKYQSQ